MANLKVYGRKRLWQAEKFSEETEENHEKTLLYPVLEPSIVAEIFRIRRPVGRDFRSGPVFIICCKRHEKKFALKYSCIYLAARMLLMCEGRLQDACYCFGFSIFISKIDRPQFCCTPTLAVPRSPRHSWGIYHIVGRVFVLPVDRNKCSVLSYEPPCRHSCYHNLQLYTWRIYNYIPFSFLIYCKVFLF
jgi:hypothetical protein